jgi:8-oxo-dGTP pyrophosphatase MutT (NUDIX family)
MREQHTIAQGVDAWSQTRGKFRLQVDPRAFERRLRQLGDRKPFEFPARSIPAGFRRAAVLLPFWEQDGAVRVLLTRRSKRMSRHAGEVAFPGGLVEPGENWEQAALRETDEEVGIDASRIDIVGRLDDAWSGARNHLVPVVGWLDSPTASLASPAEVVELLTPCVSDLMGPESASKQEVVHRGVRYVNPIVDWDGGRVFGLSADLLLEALAWASGGLPDRGPARLAELESYFAEFAEA